MRETQREKVWNHLQKYGEITNLEMSHTYNICHGPSVIKALKKTHGEDSIKFREVSRTVKEYDPEKKEYVEKGLSPYRVYFLAKLGA